ncbi:MAG TPA: M1 family metallopeptidase [Gemmatimonadales bacterium]|nr:M1 family metallopeptidase [Gemmatimonadales bacterium]
MVIAARRSHTSNLLAGLGACLVAACAPSTPSAAPVPVQSVAADTATRPVPYPVDESPGFRRAVTNGTRTRTGQPGPKYWQQWARYNLAATYAPATGLLTGTGTIRYYNRSPRQLTTVYVHLRDNLFAPGAVRNETVPLTGGVTVSRVAARGVTIAEATGKARGYKVNSTVMSIPLTPALAAGDSVDLEFAWSLTVPPEGAPRGGRTDDLAFISYWYPQMAVYDDVVGWQLDPYMSNAEFYMGYGSYDVALTVPAGFLIGATGSLVNQAEVLTPQTMQRVGMALASDTVVHVVAEADRGAGKATLAGPSLTWRFHADTVRDFAWGVSDKYVMDATRARVGDRDGNGTPDYALIHTFWLPGNAASKWAQDARYARHSIEFLSGYLWPYPWPVATAMQGPESCGGMEYPMITCIGGFQPDTFGLYGVTVHELAHMWFPMQVGSDETRHAWMDEGLTEFNGLQGENAYFAGRDAEEQDRNIYGQVATMGMEEPLMRHGDRYDTGTGYGIASYMKPATILMTLRSMYGPELFQKAFRTYGLRWQYRHPTPWDFFYSFEDVTGQDMGWFWRTWFWETWTVDQSVASVTPGPGGTTIVIVDKGLAPMPGEVKVTRSDSSAVLEKIPVKYWLDGHTSYTFTVPGAAVVRVEVDPEQKLPDVNRKNNSWSP